MDSIMNGLYLIVRKTASFSKHNSLKSKPSNQNKPIQTQNTMLFKSIAIALTLSITLAHKIKSIACNAEPGGDFLKYQIEFMDKDQTDHVLGALRFELESTATGVTSIKKYEKSDMKFVVLQYFESLKKITIKVNIHGYLNAFTGDVTLHLPYYTTQDGKYAKSATFHVANGKAVERVGSTSSMAF